MDEDSIKNKDEGDPNGLQISSDEPLDKNRNILDSAKKALNSVSKVLRRKIPCTGHLMTPRRLWIQTIPTHDCDVIIMFPNGALDTNLMWLLARLRARTPGLTVHVRHHASSDSYGFYITAPFSVLLKAAEEIHLPKSLKSEHGGGMKEFVLSDAQSFTGIDSIEHFFTSQERQYLVLHLLHTLRADSCDNIAGLKLIDGQAIIPKCESGGLILQVFPLHNLESLRQLQNEWVCSFLRSQPLDKICNYFGVKIAMYFAWLGHYTTALIVPAVIGLAFSVGFGRGDQATEDVGFVLFSFFNVLWFSIYLEAWKRYCAELAYRWGTLDQRDELLVEPRPLFSGSLEVSPVTGRLEATYPAWKRYVFRYFVTVPVIAFCLIIVFIVMMLNLKLQFQFVNSFLSLFYIAFYLQDQEKLKEQLAALLIARQVIGNLKESALPYFMEQVRLAKMSFEMFGALSPSEAQSNPEKSTNGNRNISQAELESSLFKYDGTFADHLEMFIQLGYVVLFSSAFPLAALCALINNLVEMRSDAFKLCFIFQRPFGQRVPNIGTWQNAMEVMGLIAVLVNCALIGLSGHVHRMFPEMSTTQTILLIVALEHGMLLLRLIVKVAIPDIPEWVATEMAKVEFARREAMRKFSSTSAPLPSSEISSTGGLSTKSIGRFVVTPLSNIEEKNFKKVSNDDSKQINDNEHNESNTQPSLPPTVAKPKLPRNWRQPLSHHMTVGPHASIDWVHRLNFESSRKTSEPDMGGSGLIHRSIDCLASQMETSSDSDLLRSTTAPWQRERFRLPANPLKIKSDAVETKEDDAAVKKQKAKQSLMKRARSVAIFSLKLKEKRAAAEAKSREKSISGKTEPVGQASGELSYIPIEKLISFDDVSSTRRRKMTNNSSNL